jgi:hypothetical protein
MMPSSLSSSSSLLNCSKSLLVDFSKVTFLKISFALKSSIDELATQVLLRH